MVDEKPGNPVRDCPAAAAIRPDKNSRSINTAKEAFFEQDDGRPVNAND
jgi:hypothetical protein